MIVNLFGLGLQGKSPTITAQRRLNLMYEFQPDQDKTKVSIFGTPGLTLFSSGLGATPIRGWIAVNSLFYVVHRGTFYQINNAGTITSRGTLNTTTGRVDMSYDGAVILVVDGTNGYSYTIATTTFAQVVDADYPNGGTTTTWLDGQYVVELDELFYTSADGTSWDALDFASAESAPDGIVRVFADHGEIIVFGDQTTEFWGTSGPTDFPFAPIKGSTLEHGLAAKWSLTKFDNSVAGLFKNKLGQVQIMRLGGYQAVPISNQELDSIINGYATVSDATGFSFMDRGHPMYQINFPTAMKSWRFDSSTTLWSEVAYDLSEERHRGELQLDFVNQTLLSDYNNGNIYILDADVYTDNGTPIAREIRSRHQFAGEDRTVVHELYIDMETGVGLISGQGSDPQAMLKISKDNGHTWGNELWTTIGAIGKYLTRVRWRRLGVSYDWVFSVRITDPIKVIMTFAAMRTSKGQ